MKAIHAGRANPHNNKRRKKKPSFRKQFLGTDVRTVTQLIELKASPKRKLHIARKISAYVEGLLRHEVFPAPQLALLKESSSDWKRAVRQYKAAVREENIRKSHYGTPFKDLLK